MSLVHSFPGPGAAALSWQGHPRRAGTLALGGAPAAREKRSLERLKLFYLRRISGGGLVSDEADADEADDDEVHASYRRATRATTLGRGPVRRPRGPAGGAAQLALRSRGRIVGSPGGDGAAAPGHCAGR